MRVLLVDNSQYAPTTPFFKDALQSEDLFFDEWEFGTGLRWFPFDIRAMNRELLERARQHQPHVVLVVKGMYLRRDTLAAVKADTGAIMVNYATDDPWNYAVSTPDLLASIPVYDLYCSVRKAVIPSILQSGCPRAEYVMCGYHPCLHRPPEAAVEPTSDVTLVGGADPDRVPYADALRIPGVRLALYGGYWDRIPRFRGYARGVVPPDQYVEALWSTKIAVCLVRKANRDDHTMKSMELPACGAFMLAQRTWAHESLFEDGKTAALFSTPEDLADKVRYYLGHDEERERIRRAGLELVTKGGAHTYGARYRTMLGLADMVRIDRM